MSSGNLWWVFIVICWWIDGLIEPCSGLYWRSHYIALIILVQRGFIKTVLCDVDLTTVPLCLSVVCAHFYFFFYSSNLSWGSCEPLCSHPSWCKYWTTHMLRYTGAHLQGPLNMRSLCLSVAGQGIGTSFMCMDMQPIARQQGSSAPGPPCV